MPALREKRNHGSSATPLTPRKPSRRPVTEAPFTRSMTNAKPAVLAIDLGNTGTRCEIGALEADLGLRKSYTVTAQGYNNLDNVGLGAADFPNQVNPFGDDDDWAIHHIAPGESTSIPLKELFYIECLLAHLRKGNRTKIRQILDQIPQLKSFWKEFLKRDIEERDRILQHLEVLFSVHIQKLERRVNFIIKKSNMRIAKIVMTTPANWDNEMCESLDMRAIAAWNSTSTQPIRKESVEQISEADAIAHWIVLDRPELWLHSEQSKDFLLADWGGHTLNLYRFTICQNEETNHSCFFSFKNGYSAHHGGSDCHAALVRDEVKILLTNDKRRYTPTQREALLESAMRDYRSNKMAKVNGQPIILTASQGEDFDPIRIPLDVDKCKEFYDTTVGDLLEIFALRVGAARHLGNTRVIALGGTFQNKYLLKKAKEIVLEAGLIWDETMDITRDPYFPSSIVARGAALGTQTSMSARRFVDTSCFAVNPGISKDGALKIPIIMKKSSPMEAIVQVSLDENERAKGKRKKDVEISCAPIKVEEDATSVFRPDTYYLHTLLLEPGYYKIRMSVVTEMLEDEESQPQDYLVLFYVRVKKGPNGSFDESRDPQEEKLPIFFQTGQRLVQVDQDMMASKPKKTPRNKRVSWIDYAEDREDENGYVDDGYCTCREIQDSVARGDWGQWSSSVREKDWIANRRQAENDRQRNLNLTP